MDQGGAIPSRVSRTLTGPQRRQQPLCEGSAPLSHSGSGTCVSPFDPAPAPGRQWLRHLCPTVPPPVPF
jgi:hypothetical protein